MKRLKTVLKWIAISAVGLIAILLLANAYFVWSSGTALERRLADLRRAGQPVQLSELAGSPIPPEQNADTYLQRAAADLEAMQKELTAQFPRLVFPARPLTASETEKLRTLFDAYPRVMPLLEQAAACPEYDPQIDGSLPPSKFLEPRMERITTHRVLARVLRARTTWLVAEGRRDEAVAGSLLSLRLTRHWNREPLLIGYLVTLACKDTAIEGLNEALQAGAVAPESRRSLDDELARHDSLEGLRQAMASERAFSLATTQEFPIARLWISRGFVNRLHLSLLDAYDQVFRRIDASGPSGRLQPIAQEPASFLNPMQPLVNLLGPALEGSFDATDRSLARVRCLRVLDRLQRRGVAADATARLEDLGLPAGATTDPFNGEPLHVKRLPQGWLVYSVGRDRVDNGGTLDEARDVGVGPRVPDDASRAKLQNSGEKVLENQEKAPVR